jgi:hypothetical protein
VPLTTAHAAAAWPVRVLWPSLPLAPLVIGTMSPDFEYLVRLAPGGRIFHDIPGIVFFCVPVSLAVWSLFERFVRPAWQRRLPSSLLPVIDSSPRRVPADTSSPTSWLAAALAATVGAASHVFWDSFTHAADWGVRTFPVLLRPVLEIGGHSVAGYKLLQHGSTAVGSLAIAIWILTWWRRRPEGVRRAAWAGRGPIVRAAGAIGVVAAAGAVLNGLAAPPGISFGLGRAAVGAMDGVIIGTLWIVWRDRRLHSDRSA